MQKGNKSQTIEQIKQKNMLENKKNNSILKLQLKEISSQIEQVLYLQESKKNEINVEDSSTKIDIQSYTHFQSAIDKYKKSIESMKKEINLIQYENIIKDENQYKDNIQYLRKLEKENEYLTKINKELKEQIEESNHGLEINSNQKSRELTNLKKEIKLVNDSSKILKQNIKGQNFTINNLDLEIKKIKSNIDYAKAQQEKENNMNNQKENKNDTGNNLKDLSGEELIEKIKEYQENIKTLDIEIKEQENNYNLSIKKQKKVKSKIDSDLKILNIKIKQMKKGNKIRELKLKEIKKIQEMEQKNKLKLEQERKKKEEKRKREIYKNKKFTEFQKKIRELGLNGDDEEDNARNERNNYYNHTSMNSYNYNNNYAPQSQIMPGTTKNKNYGNFSSYSNRKAPFSIKFKTNNNDRNYTQAQNDSENEMENENYDDDFENEENNQSKSKNGKVLNDIDDLKNDILNTLNKDDKNIDDKIEDIKMSNNKTNEQKSENENDGIDEYIEDDNNDINNNNENLNGNNNIDMKVSGNRSPFNISPFNNP